MGVCPTPFLLGQSLLTFSGEHGEAGVGEGSPPPRYSSILENRGLDRMPEFSQLASWILSVLSRDKV